MQLYTADLRKFDLSWLFRDLLSPTNSKPDQEEPVSYLRQWLAGTNYGMPELLSTQLEDQTVNLSWNAYLVSLLIDQNERELAFQLFSQLMSAQIALLKADHAPVNAGRQRQPGGRAIKTRLVVFCR